jgi:hypothetical protein
MIPEQNASHLHAMLQDHETPPGRLLTRLPDLNLASQAEPAYRAANFVSGYESMPVTFTPSAARPGL